MKVIKLLIQIEVPEETRWLLNWQELGEKAAHLVGAMVNVWTSGTKPRVTVIPDEKMWVEPPDLQDPKLN